MKKIKRDYFKCNEQVQTTEFFGNLKLVHVLKFDNREVQRFIRRKLSDFLLQICT